MTGRGLMRLCRALRRYQTLKIASDMKVISKTTHLLAKMHPTEGFGRFAVNISSDYVAQELAKRNRADNARELWKAMRAGMLTGAGPVLFEQEFRNFMQDKGIKKFKLRARCLSDGREEDLLFNGAPDAELASGNPKANVQPKKYYLPQKRNFQGIDSWTSEGMFQLTIADSPAINFGNATCQVFKVLRNLHLNFANGTVRLYFVVSDSRFDKWKEVQNITPPEAESIIEQRVVCFEENLPA